MLLDSTNCSHGDIKLTGGKSSNEGDVQICVNGAWGYICELDTGTTVISMYYVDNWDIQLLNVN